MDGLTSYHLYIYGSIVPLFDLGRFFSFLILYTVGRTSWTGNQSIARPLPTHRTTQTKNKRTQLSMPWVGFEPTILELERTKIIHVLDRAATVIGTSYHHGLYKLLYQILNNASSIYKWEGRTFCRNNVNSVNIKLKIVKCSKILSCVTFYLHCYFVLFTGPHTAYFIKTF
jgi:hypothetical protein